MPISKTNSILEDNYIYISHLDDGFQFWKLPTWPETITDGMQSTFTPTTALAELLRSIRLVILALEQFR